jgi:hypothetical protein
LPKTAKYNLYPLKSPELANKISLGMQILSCEEKAEIMRKQSRYRELILSGRLDLPYKTAAQLLGPDCLYHLYSLNRHHSQKTGNRKSKKP